MGGVYRLRGPASNWSGWYGDESVGWVVFSIFFSFFLFSTKLETSFRGNEGKIGRRDGDRRERRVVGKVVSTWINAFSESFWHFGIYFPYYGDGWGSIVGSLDNCMQFAPDFLSSARYTSRMGLRPIHPCIRFIYHCYWGEDRDSFRSKYPFRLNGGTLRIAFAPDRCTRRFVNFSYDLFDFEILNLCILLIFHDF